MNKSLLNFLTSALHFIQNNFKFILGVIFVIVISMSIKQCGEIRNLKNDIEDKEIEIENEKNRFKNYIENLTDSVKYHKEKQAYTKLILKVKEDELERLSGDVKIYLDEIQRMANIIQEGSMIKNIYVTDISSEVDKNDVITTFKTDSVGNFAVGISDTNQIISINTESWFNFIPDTNELKLTFVDKFGQNKASRLNYNLNFSLALAQIDLPNGKTRVLVQPRDVYGNPIPQDILNIPFVNGADFMDVDVKVLPAPNQTKNKRGFGVMVGPSYGFYYNNNSFVPTGGLGIMVGYRLF